jgi:ElaB/YqjD/DUF883 family membrane-anchored ribosome-binding protein
MTAGGTRITREEVEDRLREAVGDVDDRIEESRSTVIATAVAVGVLLVTVAYLWGRRTGRKRSTLVEIRRV